MQIQGFHSAQDVASYLSSLSTSAERSSNPTPPATGDTFSVDRASRAREIMEGHDLTNMSSNELGALSKRLLDAGVITAEQVFDLGTLTLPAGLDTDMNVITYPPDEKRNLLGNAHNWLDSAKQFRSFDTSSIAYLQKLVNLVDSLAALSEKDGLTVDALLHRKPG